MGRKRLYFLLASTLTAGAVAGSYGTSVVVTDDPIGGRTQFVEYETILRPTPPQMLATITATIASGACPAIREQGGQCNPGQIDYDIINQRERGVVTTVGRFVKNDYVNREMTSETKKVWLNGVVQSRFCPIIDARYGPGVCDPLTIDYTIRNVRTNRQSRTYAKFKVPVFCVETPPADPDPPEVEP